MEDLAGLLEGLDKIEEPKKEKKVKIEQDEEEDDKPKRQRKPMVSQDLFDSKIKDLYEVIEILQSDIHALSNQVKSPVQIIKKQLSPAELYDALLFKYQLPASITYEELKILTIDKISNVDHLKFLQRYKKSRADFDLFNSVISSYNA